jgi:hypothetical protein
VWLQRRLEYKCTEEGDGVPVDEIGGGVTFVQICGSAQHLWRVTRVELAST